jgi:drug/metabolite transporter (DMT)-like permease
MLLNTFIIFISFLIYLIYSTSNNYIQLQQILNKYYNLTYLQFISAFTFSISTIITTFFIIKIDKNTTNPLINELMIKSITTIIVIFTSIYIFGESFTNYKLLGIIFLMLGLFLLS